MSNAYDPIRNGPGLLPRKEVVRQLDAKDARIAELEALTQSFTESELARAEGVLNIAMNAEWRTVYHMFPPYSTWLRSTVQAVAEALVEDREKKEEPQEIDQSEIDEAMDSLLYGW